MELKVRVLDSEEQQSASEREAAVLEAHAEQEAQQEAAQEPVATEEAAVSEEPSISEEKVLSFLNERYGKEISDVGQLFEERESAPELPEDVEAFFKYKKETGRSLEDFVALNKDYDSVDENQLLAQYYSATEDGLDEEDVKYMVEELSYDEDLDDEAQIKKQQRAKKKEVAKAKKYFNDLKEQYKVPIESKGNFASEEDAKNYEAYQQYIKDSKTVQEQEVKRSQWFIEKTDKLFNDEFKGFEFSLGDKTLNYKPASAEELKKSQSDVMNFINKHIDEDGLLKDAQDYHRALSVAMNPTKFAQFFYEQGKADAIDDVSRKSKNINMDTRKTPEVTSKAGLKVRSVTEPSSRGLKIKSARRV